MNRPLALTILLSCAGCATAPYVAPNVPLARAVERPVARAAAPQRETPQGFALREVDGESTRAWFEQEIDRARYVPPPPPPPPVVETRVVIEREYVPYDDGYYGDDYYGGYRHYPTRSHRVYRSRYDHGHQHRGSWFPINTAVGAGVGAIVGHQSGRRDRGAAIGAGVGLLFDLARW